MKGVSVLSKERLTEKTKDCFGYRLKDGSDAGIGFFKDYDAFYSHMMVVRALGEYEDLDEQGLLLRLPCKVGDTVWEIVDECEGDSAGCYGTCNACHNKWLGIKETKFTIDMIDEVGNWFFLTQSEAEEKLRELEEK